MSKPPRKTVDKTANKPTRKTRPDWMGAETPSRPDRIDVDDTPANAVFKLVQGDPSAAEACIALVKAVAIADPQAEFGPFTPLLILEAAGLTGPAIGHVYRKVCDSDPVTMLAVLHAVRLKVIAMDAVKRAAVSGTRIRADTVIEIVRQKIPNFARV
jgi:hypothetical protein